jgi:hypothetical protein
VTDTLALVTQDRNQSFPVLACASGGQVLLAYQGWTGTFAGRSYNSERIWGKLVPFTGVSERPVALPGSTWPGASVVHEVICLPPATSSTSSAGSVLRAGIRRSRKPQIPGGTEDRHPTIAGGLRARSTSSGQPARPSNPQLKNSARATGGFGWSQDLRLRSSSRFSYRALVVQYPYRGP